MQSSCFVPPLHFLFRRFRSKCDTTTTQIKISKMGYKDKGHVSSSDRGNFILKQMEKIYRCSMCLSLPICDVYQCREGHLICKDCYN